MCSPWFFSSALPPRPLLLHGIENQQIVGEASGPGSEEVVPPTPDVDLLLECTFSYMHSSEEDKEEHQPMKEHEEEFLSPLIGPEEEEEVC